ncbi:protein ACCELERATED CELL DEATH 6 [Vigna radiata var. radiata]|uniref:Protein ACCELERATED CELL DEATH 6 n=1 Tax=Vigna radiata var. radiata TaxID=3916 RepID=A0A3Q0EW53_VIGRR|nr:protein ACCELERATED CELL DEATH 6 [Vigna radiata var. radiata]
MNNDDVENSYKGEEQPSRNMIEEKTLESSEERRSDEAKAHGWSLLPKKTYDSIKENKPESDWREIDDDTILQQRPRGNTVLHIAALYGNDKCVERIVEIGPGLLRAENGNDDTALHVAARAGNISTLKNLLDALFRHLNPNSEEAKEVIFVTNRQKNTFFHEALQNGHKDVMKILDSSQDFKKLVEETLFVSTNNNDKSVLRLAIEKGYEDIVDDILTRIIPSNEEKYSLLVKANTEPISNHVEFSYPDGGPVGTYPQFGLEELGASDSGARKKGEQQYKSEGRMAFMDMEMEKIGRSMRTFSKNEGARSPAIVAILRENKGIIEKIANRKKEWIHVKDDRGRNALHYAASKGYLNGVECLLQKCDTCNMETDRDGFYPLHLASACGHIQVVKKLLENCPNPREIIDNKGRNIVHIAAIMGQFDVVRYALHNANDVIKDMINGKDYDGNTPLHLAASHYRPKIVQALTWNTSVDLNWLNNNNQTPLDAFEQFKQQDNPPIVQRLTWCQLKSSGVQNAERGSHSIQVPFSPLKPKAENIEFYKDRINTLMVVSTLITTIAFAGGITLPGGTNSSTPGEGMALMLNQVWFKPYILCTTISMYGGISVTIILIWAQLGDVTLALFALKVARPLLGITLATLSVAFLAGVHLVISDLSLLATTVLILCVVFIILLLLLYTLLWFPSESSNLIMRYISFYPFQFLTWLTEKDSIEGM